MASDPDLERAYPYCSGWRVMGCGVLMFGLMGGAALALIPFGWEKVQNGQMPIGVAMVVGGLFGAPMLFMAVFALVTGIRDTISPPLLRVVPRALLPESLKGLPDRRGRRAEAGRRGPTPKKFHSPRSAGCGGRTGQPWRPQAGDRRRLAPDPR